MSEITSLTKDASFRYANALFSLALESKKTSKYEKDLDIEPITELELDNNKPSYMALKQDECNATVKVTEKTGLEIVGTESFDVNVCKKEVYKIIN